MNGATETLDKINANNVEETRPHLLECEGAQGDDPIMGNKEGCCCDTGSDPSEGNMMGFEMESGSCRAVCEVAHLTTLIAGNEEGTLKPNGLIKSKSKPMISITDANGNRAALSWTGSGPVTRSRAKLGQLNADRCSIDAAIACNTPPFSLQTSGNDLVSPLISPSLSESFSIPSRSSNSNHEQSHDSQSTHFNG